MTSSANERAATLAEVHRAAAGTLAAAGVEDAPLEAEVLLRHVLGLDRAAFFARIRAPIAPQDAAAYEELVARRLRREPTAYLTGRREFFSLDFRVTPDALIPRPETELLVEATLGQIAGRAGPLVVDVGAGCGAIAVAVAVNQPAARVIATDVSAPALGLTRENARRHGVSSRVAAVRTDLLAGLRAPFDVIVANLPYVRSRDWETLAPEIREHEPRLALDGGPDGLDVIRRLLLQAAPFVVAGSDVYVEIGDDQAAAATAAARIAVPPARVSVRQDLTGRDRLLIIEP